MKSLFLLYTKVTECLSFYVFICVCVCICKYIYLLLEDFYHEAMLNFSKAFSALIEIVMCCLPLTLFVLFIKLVDLHVLYPLNENNLILMYEIS